MTIYQGKKHAFCSAACEYIFHEDPQRYLGYPTLYELYQGKSLGEFLRSNNMLRADGKTLMGGPSVSLPAWTIDDIDALGVEIKDPLEEVTV